MQILSGVHNQFAGEAAQHLHIYWSAVACAGLVSHSWGQ